MIPIACWHIATRFASFQGHSYTSLGAALSLTFLHSTGLAVARRVLARNRASANLQAALFLRGALSLPDADMDEQSCCAIEQKSTTVDLYLPRSRLKSNEYQRCTTGAFRHHTEMLDPIRSYTGSKETPQTQLCCTSHYHCSPSGLQKHRTQQNLMRPPFSSGRDP